MGGTSNPFEVLLVIVAIGLITMAAFGIVAPSFVKGINVPDAPKFPSLPDLTGQGNLNATYPFNQTFLIQGYETVKFDNFNPDKLVVTKPNALGTDILQVQRFGSVIAGFGFWYDEPISYLDGRSVPKIAGAVYGVSIQAISDNFNGTYSTFVVDSGSKEYECYMSISPRAGYTDLVSSWNVGHGVRVMLYGSAFVAPSWLDQIGAYLYFGGSIIAFFVLEVWYAVQMMGIFGELFGLSSALAGALTLLVILFAGAMLMFIRGNSNK
jgi:hypothetical protein